MKKFLFSAVILIGLLVSCQDESFSDVGLNSLETGDPAQKAIVVRTSTVFDWEDNSKMKFPGLSQTITMPWYNGATGAMPFYMTAMCKKTDGWVMVYNYCTDMVEAKEGKYYLMFYNEFYGTLRVFYYNASNIQRSSTTFWTLDLDRVTSLLNTTTYFSEPANERKLLKASTTNVVKHPAKAINPGWNCFDMEFSYDPNLEASMAPLKMFISAYDVTTSNIQMIGDVQLSSEGAIVTRIPTTTSKNSLAGNAVSLVGNAAGKYIGAKLGSPQVGEIVGEGFNKLFGSFLGKKKTTTTIQEYESTLKIKTSGTVNLRGEINTPTAAGIQSLNKLVVPHSKIEATDDYLPSYNGSFGAWSLKERPIINYSDEMVAYRERRNAGSSSYPNWIPDGDWQFVRYMGPGWGPANGIQVLINPALKDKIKDYTVSSELIYCDKLGSDEKWAEKNDVFINSLEFKRRVNYKVINNSRVIHSSELGRFYNSQYWGIPYDPQIYSPSGIDCTSESRPRVQVIKMTDQPFPAHYANTMVKVTVTLYPKAPYDETPIVSTRTYLPKFERKKDIVPTFGW